MIPKRTLTAEIEISTGKFTITSVPPTFMGEKSACIVDIDLCLEGVAYTPSNAVAEMYLYWPGSQQMTVAVEMVISGSNLSATMSEVMMARAGNPLLVVQLTDIDTGDLVVAASAPISIYETRGGMVIDSRAPSPSEVIYIGRSPYVDPTTKHWMEWSNNTSAYVDTGIYAEGRSPYVNTQTNHWMEWDPETEEYVDSGVSAVGIGAASFNGIFPDPDTHDISADADDIPSGVTGTGTSVEDDLRSLSGQIANVEIGSFMDVTTLNELKTNLLATANQMVTNGTFSKLIKFYCRFNDEGFSTGASYSGYLKIVVSSNDYLYFVINISSNVADVISVAYNNGVWLINNLTNQIVNVATVITGTTNNSGHAISSGEYFITNGAKYKASATIDTGATWSDKSISVSDHDLINALNANITSLSGQIAKSSSSLTTSNLSSNISSASASYFKFGNIMILVVNVTANTDIAVGNDITLKVNGMTAYGGGRGCGYSGSTMLSGAASDGGTNVINVTIRVLGSQFVNQYSGSISIPMIVV